MHCIEGGFHLGAAIDEIDASVAELARRGRRLRHPRPPQGAPPTRAPFFDGRAAASRRLGVPPRSGRCTASKVLIDISHMNQRALCETFALLERLDRESGRRRTSTR